jgi:uncharacterized protein YhbP (UPF0306 family)
MDKHIVDFIKKQTVASICCLDQDNAPYCFSCFYAFDEVNALLYFKSSSSSKHSAYLMQDQKVAGTINPDKLNKLAIKGIQFSGIMLTPGQVTHANQLYHMRFPFALAMAGDLWAVCINEIKMTDSTMGFGKKINWKRSEEAANIPASDKEIQSMEVE